MTEYSIANKNKKSKNEIVRTAVGSYLRQRNYMANERYRKSDLVLTQTTEQIVMNSAIKNDISRTNSFLYSNLFCLNNHPTQVDQQFSKLIEFIRIQRGKIKTELNSLLPALLCHLYIEMLKGREWRLSIEFLKKYSVLIGPIETNSTNTQQNKINGSVEDNATATQPTTTSNQTINFIDTSVHSMSSEQQSTTARTTSKSSTTESKDIFKSIIHQMSQMKHLQDMENSDDIINFRSCKYNISMSSETINILQNYLSKHSHVLILQIIHNWFNIETSDEDAIIKSRDDSDDDDDDNFNDENIQDFILANGYTSRLVHYKLQRYNNNNEEINEENIDELEVEAEVDCNCAECDNEECADDADEEEYSARVSKCVQKLEQFQLPIRVFSILNADRSLTSASLDTECCHMVGGFNDSSVQIWPLNRSIQMGRKPFQTLKERLCNWNITQCDDNSSSDDDIEEPIDYNIPHGRQIRRGERKKKFLDSPNDEHLFTDTGGYIFRGHSGVVTDVLFSKDNNFIFSVSRDLTMRAWKANDYSCASVYRGHNYPIWCVTENSTGQYLATGSKDATARLWSVDRKYPLHVYVGHTQDVDAIAFHPNGLYLVTASTDLSLRLWCITSGQQVRIFTNCKLPIHSIKFSPDGKYLAAGGEDQAIRIFDLAMGSQILELSNPSSNSGVTDLDWSFDSQRLASTHSNAEVKIWDVSTIPPNNENTSEETTYLIESYETGCTKVVKVQFNNSVDGYSFSCIGAK